MRDFTSSVRESTSNYEHEQKKTKLRNAMRGYEGKYHTHRLSEEHDIGLHQSLAAATSRGLFFLDQLSNLGGIERCLAINTTL